MEGIFDRNRTNPFVSGAVAVAGLVVLIAGYRWIGFGIVVGSGLAYVNSTFLSKRVDAAALSQNVGVALMVMQVGLITTLILIAAVTVVLIQFSASMAVASAGGFAFAQIATLVTYYWQHGRRDPKTEVNADVTPHPASEVNL